MLAASSSRFVPGTWNSIAESREITYQMSSLEESSWTIRLSRGERPVLAPE